MLHQGMVVKISKIIFLFVFIAKVPVFASFMEGEQNTFLIDKPMQRSYPSSQFQHLPSLEPDLNQCFHDNYKNYTLRLKYNLDKQSFNYYSPMPVTTEE
jgi:hypothetical protein